MSIYLVWPLALALCVALVFGLATLGLQWRENGRDAALDKGVSVFLNWWVALTIIFVLFVNGQWAGPLILALLQQTTVIREKEQVQHRWTRLGGRAAKRPHVPSFSHEVESIEPQSDPWVREAYEVICTLWNQDLTRAAFKRNWPRGGTEMYYRYVAGKGNEKGWFEQWNVIEPADKRGKMRFSCRLEDVFRADDDLWTYATRMRQLSPAPPGRSRNRVGG